MSSRYHETMSKNDPKSPKLPLEQQGPTTGQAFFLVLFMLAVYMALGLVLPSYLLASEIVSWPDFWLQGLSSMLFIMLSAIGLGAAIARLLNPAIPVQWNSGLQVNPYSGGQQTYYSERTYKRYSRQQYLTFSLLCAAGYALGLWILSI